MQIGQPLNRTHCARAIWLGSLGGLGRWESARYEMSSRDPDPDEPPPILETIRIRCRGFDARRGIGLLYELIGEQEYARLRFGRHNPLDRFHAMLDVSLFGQPLDRVVLEVFESLLLLCGISGAGAQAQGSGLNLCVVELEVALKGAPFGLRRRQDDLHGRHRCT